VKTVRCILLCGLCGWFLHSLSGRDAPTALQAGPTFERLASGGDEHETGERPDQ